MQLLQLDYRDKALAELKAHFFTLLKKDIPRNILAFQAPTGSGKTVAMAMLLRDVVNELPTHFDILHRDVTFIWIAPNSLHLQSYHSLSHFYSETRAIRTLGIEDITDDCLHLNEMLFLNWQTINRDDTLFMRENEQGKNFYNILARTALNDTQIVVIIDEEHLMAGGATAEKAEHVLRQIQPKIEIRVSATLTDRSMRSNHRVIIPREDVVKAQMIKKGVHLNPKLRADEQDGRDADMVILEKALQKRKELQEQYAAAGTNINPLLLIQLPSDKKTISAEDTRIRDLVVEYLTVQGIMETNGKLAVWLSGEKTNLEDISKPDNMVEVLLFKQAIALGWDCPRASVLLIYRELHSETFTVQTMGRILRMPEQKHYADDHLNYGYVHTNLNKELITILPEEADYITENRAERRDDIYRPVALRNHYIQKEIVRNRIGLHFRQALFEAAEQMFELSMDGEGGESFYYQNKERLKARAVVMDVDTIDIPIPADVSLDVTAVGATRADHVEHFAKTTYQLEQLFNRFCYQSCGDYQKDASWERIKYHTEVLFEEYLGMFGADVYKVVLYNEPSFRDLINLALDRYAAIMAARASNRTAQVKESEAKWDVPPFRIYSDKYRQQEASAHALNPLFARDRGGNRLYDSDNEHRFVDYLLQHEDQLQWWYKNGSSNREDFAVPYLKADGTPSLFYVDIVMQFKSGLLGLFDPKTQESDPENALKHNALIEFISNLGLEGRKAIGGIVVPHQGSWKFCRNKIEHDRDLTGWEIFNPAVINAQS